MLLLICCTLVYSSCLVFVTVINLIVVPYGYSNEAGSWFGFVNCLAGVPGSIIAGVYLFGKRSSFNSVTLFVIFGTIISMAVFHLSFISMNETKGFTFEMIIIIINGLFISTLISYSFEYAIELAPTISEEMSSGVIMLLINLFAFIQLTLIGYFYDTYNKKKVVDWIMII